MRALVYDDFQTTPSVREVAAPSCPADGAVIDVRATGLCRSDWHGWMGHDPDVTPPHVPGHELAGVIASVGAEVVGWSAGDRVTAPFVNACGACEPCSHGAQQVCDNQVQPGFTHWGSFAEQVVIHHADVNLVALPQQVDFATAAALGCRFATAYRAVVQLARVTAGEWVAVHGCGGVGLSAVMIAASRGARVIAVDTSPAALILAKELGAEVTTSDGATVQGAHVSIDALGRKETFAHSIACLRTHGRHVQIGLMLAADAMPRLDVSAVIAKELQILGAHGLAAHSYAEMLDEIVTGRLDPARLVHRTISLDEAADALMTMDTQPRPGATVILL